MVLSQAPHSLYHLGEAGGAQADVLLHHLHGAMDAGRAGRGLIGHLLDTLPVTRVASFDTDSLIDFRSHRPWLKFEDWSFTSASMPEISLDLLRDDCDRKLLVLHGPEPDYHWGAFVAAVAELVRSCGVKEVLSVMGMPAGVPHTRPTPVHYHASRPALLPKQPEMVGQMQIPAGMDQMLEYQLGAAGIDAVGMVAGVPYYLAEGDFPPSSAALAKAVAERTGLALPIGDLEAASTMALGQIGTLIEESDEAGQLIKLLEENFDASADFSTLQDEADSLPTADEIGARLEAFLEQNDKQARRIAVADLNRQGTALPSAGLSNLGKTPYLRRNIDSIPPRPRGRHRADPQPGE